MSHFIDDNLAYEVEENGELVGEQEPTRESKWTYYAVYRYKNNVYAIILDSTGVIGGEQITEQEISQYI
jgi:hypothetical protein